jgi:lipoprotein signal peptidase
MPAPLDDLLTVVFNSLGVWICCIINTVIIYGGGAEFSRFTSTYGYLLSVPVIIFLTRMLYKKTKSIWIGAAISAMILAWHLATTIGYNIYVP